MNFMKVEASGGEYPHLYVTYKTPNGRHQKSFAPGGDVSGEAPQVQALAAQKWTPDVLAAWQDFMSDLNSQTPEQIRAGIKGEAYRRIVAVCPEWKQRNLTAQAAILAKKGEANWTAEEAAAWAAGEAIWGQIAAIRAASDQLEAMDPLPSDFTDDQHWP